MDISNQIRDQLIPFTSVVALSFPPFFSEMGLNPSLYIAEMHTTFYCIVFNVRAIFKYAYNSKITNGSNTNEPPE